MIQSLKQRISRQKKEREAPKIGLALGGGGIRGLAHIGILKVLEQEGIPIHYIAGTSMGGIIAAAYGAGLSAAHLEAEVLRLGRFDQLIKLADWRFSRKGLIPGKQIHAYFAELVGSDLTFADLKFPIALVAVDLDRGYQVILSEGLVIDAMRATMSVPGVFVPVNQNNRRLVDGGILNNVPTNVAQQLGANRVIGVDVMPVFSEQTADEMALFQSFNLKPFPPIAQNVAQMIFMMMAAQTENNLRQTPPSLLLRPQLPPEVTLFRGFDRVAEIIAQGEAVIRAQLPQLHQCLSTLDH